MPLTSCNSEGYTGVHIQNENGEILMCKMGVSSYYAYSNGVYDFDFSDGTSISTEILLHLQHQNAQFVMEESNMRKKKIVALGVNTSNK